MIREMRSAILIMLSVVGFGIGVYALMGGFQ